MARLDWTLPVRTLIHHFQNHDFGIISVHDGEEHTSITSDPFTLAERNEATDAITAVDEAWLKVAIDDKFATIYIVLGNEPDELVADYSCCEELMPLVDEAVEAHRNQWEGKRCPVSSSANHSLTA